ncbi:MAG: hypothetical protein WBF69_01965 [Castellaniella sp.]|uniref:bestrophin-like domain n=1 Tax=Castellaniella sp. TaxID=1955812 RepID=UPI003C78EE6D
MFEFIHLLPAWLKFVACVLFVGLITVAALGMMSALRRFWPPGPHGHNMVATMLSGILVPTGMVVALVAADIWQQDAKGHAAVEHEASAVIDVLRVAKFLPGDQRENVTGLTDDYIREVVENEWPIMSSGRWSPAAEDLLEALVVASVQIEAAADRLGQRRAAEELRRYAHDIERARDDRLLIARSPGIMSAKGTVVLMLLFVAACVLCELHLHQRRSLAIAMLLFSLSFGATLYLIMSFDRPFMGTNQIQPESLSLLLIRG